MAGVGASFLSREQLSNDLVHRIRRGLTEVRRARCRHRALKAPLTEHRAVIDADQFEIDQRAHVFLRLALPAPDLADEYGAGEFSLASDAKRRGVIGRNRNEARVL